MSYLRTSREILCNPRLEKKSNSLSYILACLNHLNYSSVLFHLFLNYIGLVLVQVILSTFPASKDTDWEDVVFRCSLPTVQFQLFPSNITHLVFGSFFMCQKNVCESVLHPVNLFVSCKYLLAAYMIKWQPTTVCKRFSQGISRDHYSSHYLHVWEPAGLQGDDASPETKETCITCTVTYARSKWWRKKTLHLQIQFLTIFATPW